MFTPSSNDVRRFFCEAFRKQRAGEVLTPMDAIAADWILHLSMHLSITEQVSIDQPRGIRAAHELLAARMGEHEAQHQIMECLGEAIWTSQRSGLPPDQEAYVECVRRRATM
jgi:hypothetical protein